MFIYYLFSLLLFLILLIVLILLFLWMWNNIKSRVPFVTVPSDTLSSIEKAMQLNDNSVVYDLGSGDGKVLFYLYKHNMKAQYVGIENSEFPFFLSSIRNWYYKKRYKSNIKFIKRDFFDVNLSRATHIFTYLYPDVMDDLLPKLDQELNPGTKLVSASYHFTTKRELSMIDLKKGKYNLAKCLYIYEF